MVYGLRGAGSAVLDLLLPPECPQCQAPVLRHGLLCHACFGALTFIAEPLCRSCGQAFIHPKAGRRRFCARCDANPPLWHEARAALVYDAFSRGLVLSLKHADRTELAAVLGYFMHRAGGTLLAEADVLVPVPLHPSRLRQRRFNQSVLLARSVARRAGLPVCADALRRVLPTALLGHASAAARAALLRQAIVARPRSMRMLRGRRVLLVDDVLTSGATANACAAALLDAGACRVDVLVACRVPEPRTEEQRHETEPGEDDA